VTIKELKRAKKTPTSPRFLKELENAQLVFLPKIAEFDVTDSAYR
jgi:hypothetical protein